MALTGATVILNPSASDEVIGKAGYRRDLVCGQSARLYCAYAYADAGRSESTTDLVFAGDNIIAENGSLLARSELFSTGMVAADVDLDRLAAERPLLVHGRALLFCDRSGSGSLVLPSWRREASRR